MNRLAALACMATALLFSTPTTHAQQPPGGGGGPGGPGGFDPEQMRQRMMERYREQFEIKSDDEWKIIEERVTKVMEARRDVGMGGFGRGMFGMGGRNRGGGQGGPGGQGGGAQAAAGGQGGGGQDQARRAPRGFGGEPSPEMEELQKALESKAPAEEVKTKLAKLREVQKAKEAKLEKAQEDLRKVLTVRQEAAAVLAGLLK